MKLYLSLYLKFSELIGSSTHRNNFLWFLEHKKLIFAHKKQEAQINISSTKYACFVYLNSMVIKTSSVLRGVIKYDNAIRELIVQAEETDEED